MNALSALEAAAIAFQRHLVRLAVRTVTPIDGMYENTEIGAQLHAQYNRRPLGQAHKIIYTQTVFPTCMSCYHPVLDGKLHADDYCVRERQSMGCMSNRRVMTLPQAFNTPRCATADCHHRIADGALCSCCQNGLIDSPAKIALLESLSPQPSYAAQSLAMTAYGPLFTHVIAGGQTHQATGLLRSLDSMPNG